MGISFLFSYSSFSLRALFDGAVFVKRKKKAAIDRRRRRCCIKRRRRSSYGRRERPFFFLMDASAFSSAVHLTSDQDSPESLLMG